MTRMTSLRAALLVASGLLAACSSDTDSTESSAGIMTLEFEIEAAQIDDHPFPSDVYLDRAFLTQPMGAPPSDRVRTRWSHEPSKALSDQNLLFGLNAKPYS